MSKRLTVGALLVASLFVATPAHAEDGAWAVLDADNHVVNVIVCTPEVCGDPDFASKVGGSKLVLQAKQEPNGNVAGYLNDTTYTPETNTFNLPHGGTLQGGAALSEATWPEPDPEELLLLQRVEVLKAAALKASKPAVKKAKKRKAKK